MAVLSAVRLGAYDIAVGNLFGSNVFNMFALATADLFYTGGSFFEAINPGFALAGLIAMLLTLLVLLYDGLLKRSLLGLLYGTIAFALLMLLAFRLRIGRLLAWWGGSRGAPSRSAAGTLLLLLVLSGMAVTLSAGYHILGTDKVGEDVFYQALKSIRTGLVIGTLTTLVMLPAAILLGIMAGYFKGWVDDLIQYLYTTLNSIPGVLLIAAAVLMLQVYMDNNATSMIAPEVVEAMMPYLTEAYGNPSSMHTFGGVVGEAVAKARQQVATLLGSDPEEITFTSCGTESDSTAILSALRTFPEKRHVITTRVEHPAVKNLCENLEPVTVHKYKGTR